MWESVKVGPGVVLKMGFHAFPARSLLDAFRFASSDRSFLRTNYRTTLGSTFTPLF